MKHQFLFVSLLASVSFISKAGNPVDVYLLGGQSNATGQGYLAKLPKGITPDTRVLLFHSGSPHLNSGAQADTWIPLRQASESPDRFGPELGFGNKIKELKPATKIAIIKHAHSGTNLYKDWVPGETMSDSVNWGKQFKIFIETVEAGMKGLRDMGYEPVIRGMLWQQGEGDADVGGEVSEKYGTNLAHFIARVREQLKCPDMLFVYGYVYPAPNVKPGMDLVRKGEYEVWQDSHSPIAVKGAFVVSTEDLNHRADDVNTPYPNDYIHFGTLGTYELGIRMAEKMNNEFHKQNLK